MTQYCYYPPRLSRRIPNLGEERATARVFSKKVTRRQRREPSLTRFREAGVPELRRIRQTVNERSAADKLAVSAYAETTSARSC
jgi:hypothetical protein